MNLQQVTFERAFGLTEQLPASDCMEFAFVGRSNVGKSSLLNRLFSRKSLARVSSMPGKTATVNFYRCREARFVDLPGYGYAKVAKGEQRRYGALINGYLGQDRDIALVFLLIDMRHPPSADDLAMAEYLMDAELPFVVVLTKSDKLNKTQRTARLQALEQELPCEGLTMIPCSSETGEGIEELHAILDELTADEQEDQ